MARYTGPSWKQSRRLKFSVLEMVKNYKREIMLQVNMDKEEQSFLNMVFNYKKNKKFVSLMVLMKNNSEILLTEHKRWKVNMVKTS